MRVLCLYAEPISFNPAAMPVSGSQHKSIVHQAVLGSTVAMTACICCCRLLGASQEGAKHPASLRSYASSRLALRTGQDGGHGQPMARQGSAECVRFPAWPDPLHWQQWQLRTPLCTARHTPSCRSDTVTSVLRRQVKVSQPAATPPSTPTLVAPAPAWHSAAVRSPAWPSPPWGPPTGAAGSWGTQPQYLPNGAQPPQPAFGASAGPAQGYHPGLLYPSAPQPYPAHQAWPRRASAPAALAAPFGHRPQPRPPPGGPPANGWRSSASTPAAGAAQHPQRLVG